jgi:hypothetical protein
MAATIITIGKAPRLSVSNIKSHRGMEGFTLDCDLYLDGKKVRWCLDDGNGGGMYFNWAGYEPKQAPEETRQKTQANKDAVMQYITSLNLPPEIDTVGSKPFEMKQDLEHLVNGAVGKWESEKAQRAQFTRTYNSNVIYRMPGDGDKFWTVKLKGKGGHVFSREEVKAHILRKSPQAKFVDTFEDFLQTT